MGTEEELEGTVKGLTCFDLEANGWVREADTIWCIAARNFQSRKEWFFGPHQIEEGLQFLASCECIVAHNLLGYDLPLIQRLYPDFVPPLYEDSLILSRLFNPDRGGHSIEDWGLRFGSPKPEHEDWTRYSDEMGHRCREDTRILTKVMGALVQEAGGHDWSDSTCVEYDCQLLQNAIEQRGVNLSPELEQTADLLDTKMQQVKDILDDSLPLRVLPKGTVVMKPFTAAGSVAKRAAKLVDEELIAGPFSGVQFEPLNLGSPKQLTEFLYSIGWKPTEFNYKKAKRGGYELNPDGTYVISSPKVTEDSLEDLDHPVARHLLDYRILKHRLGILRRINQQTKQPGGWIHERRDDGRVEAQAIVCGTPTHRYTHRQIVNLPKVDTPYGEYIRSMLIPTDGLIMAGTDAQGLEARVAAHYTYPYDDGEYAHEIMDGDIHTKNADAFSRVAGDTVPRQQAKNIMYALLYGARTRKIATMVGCSMDLAEALIDTFWSSSPGLGQLNEDILNQAKTKGHLIGIDGRKIHIRSPHAALNSYFQSCGAVLMKWSFRAVRDDQRWPMLLTMHDEWLCELEESALQDHVDHITNVGEQMTNQFKLNVPLEFDTQTGMNYAECH